MLTPQEQETLLLKNSEESSEQRSIYPPTVQVTPPTIHEFPSVTKHDDNDQQKQIDSSRKGNGIKRMAAFVAIICAMLVGAGIAIAMMSNKNDPAAGVNAFSGMSTTSIQLHSQETIMTTALSANHDSYSYEDGLLTIKSDDYYKSDYKEYTGLTDVKRVKIESGVTTIGSKSFDGCRNLSSIEIPDTVTSIGESAFEDCEGLTSIVFPDTLQTIEGFAFAGCTSLQSIYIPKSVSKIGNLAFSKCSGLEAIEVDENNPCFFSADGVLFDKDQNILYKYPPAKSDNSYVIPDSVQYIDDHAFCVCPHLSNVTIPEGTISIGDRAFSSCKVLTSINLPTSLTYIGVWAFSACSKVNTLTIPSTVTSVDHSAFNKWNSNQTIIIQGRQTPPDTWHTNWNAGCNANIVGQQ